MTSVLFLKSHLPWLLRQDLSLLGSSLIRFNYLVSELQGSTYVCLSLELTSVSHRASFCTWTLGVKSLPMLAQQDLYYLPVPLDLQLEILFGLMLPNYSILSL